MKLPKGVLSRVIATRKVGQGARGTILEYTVQNRLTRSKRYFEGYEGEAKVYLISHRARRP